MTTCNKSEWWQHVEGTDFDFLRACRKREETALDLSVRPSAIATSDVNSPQKWLNDVINVFEDTATMSGEIIADTNDHRDLEISDEHLEEVTALIRGAIDECGDSIRRESERIYAAISWARDPNDEERVRKSIDSDLVRETQEELYSCSKRLRDLGIAIRVVSRRFCVLIENQFGLAKQTSNDLITTL